MKTQDRFNWGLALAGAVIAAILATGSAAIAGAGGPISKGKIHACVTRDYSTLNLTSAKAKCPDGQRKIAWNLRGPRGKRGLPGPAGKMGPAGPRGQAGQAGANGADGAIGPTGPTGAQGLTGETGPTGEQGPAGANGTDGLPGQPGQPGDTGPTGATGATGSTGATGATGSTGPAGPFRLISSGRVVVGTDLLGNPSSASLLPPTGYMAEAKVVSATGGPALSITLAAAETVQSLPNNMRLDSVAVAFTSLADVLTPSLTIEVGLYVSPDYSSTFSLLNESKCAIAVAAIFMGDTLRQTCSFAPISIPNDSLGVIGVMIRSDSDLTSMVAAMTVELGLT